MYMLAIPFCLSLSHTIFITLAKSSYCKLCSTSLITDGYLDSTGISGDKSTVSSNSFSGSIAVYFFISGGLALIADFLRLIFFSDSAGVVSYFTDFDSFDLTRSII